MKKNIIGLSILIVIVLLSGCSTRHGDFTVLSNKIINTKNFNISNKQRVNNVYGEDVAHIIIFFPTKPKVSPEGALDNAIDKTDGDVMTDAVVHQWGWYIPYVYGQIGWSVQGDVVKTRDY